MINHILVPIDGSKLAECVLPHAISFAKAFNAKITLLRVLDPEGNIDGKRTPIKTFDWRMHQTEAENYLVAVQKQLQKLDIEVNFLVLEGSISDRIIDYVNQNKVDFVILSSHGQSGHSGWNVSSNVQRILINVFKPILIIRATLSETGSNAAYQYKKIVIPLDLSQRAECAISSVTWIARHFHANLIPIHLVNRPDMPSRVPLSDSDKLLLDSITERNRQEAESYLNQLKNRMESEEFSFSPHIVACESISTALHEYIAKSNADLVAFCAHGYSGKSHWPFSSLVTNFIAFGTTPLLIVQDMTPDQVKISMGQLTELQKKGH
ncbi:MAG: universal stress protein [Anaerolineaceae bacterium]|nr:universal stress protein [Anaerolineaceae bacterium]